MAQPTMTTADLTPVFGTWITSYFVDYVAPGPATANFNYNVGDLVVHDTTTQQIAQPDTTLSGNSFPNATYALAIFVAPVVTVEPTYEYTYMQLDSSSLRNIGNEWLGHGTILSDGIELIRLPCSMGNTWAGTFTASSVNVSDIINESGSYTAQCNGYGTLVLPYATFTNVLRVQAESTYIRIWSGVDTSTTISTGVSYWVAGIIQPIFQSNTVINTDPGQSPQIVQYSAMLDAISVGIEEAKGNGPSALLFPNPTNDAFTVAFNTPVTGSTTITLLDALGRKVSDLQPTNGISKATTMSFDVSSFPRGMYIVRITDAQGRSSNMPLVLR